MVVHSYLHTLDRGDKSLTSLTDAGSIFTTGCCKLGLAAAATFYRLRGLADQFTGIYTEFPDGFVGRKADQ